MPSPGHYAGFDVARRDADGVIYPLPGETISIRFVAGADIEDVTTDAHGGVRSAQMTMGGSPGNSVEFYSNTYTDKTLIQVLVASPEDAFSPIVTLLVEDLYATKSPAKVVEVYIEDLSDANIPIQKVGSAPEGGTLTIPYTTPNEKGVNVHLLTIDNFNQQSDFSFATTEFQNKTLGALEVEGTSSLGIDSLILNSPTPRGMLYVGDSEELKSSPAISASQSIRRNAGNTAFEAYTPASGTVTSVALSLPSIFSVSGSPVTATGTLTGALANQTANKLFAGPVSGSAAAPTFRSIVAADLGSGTGSSSNWLRGDLAWGNPLTVGNPISSGTNNYVNYQASGNLAQSQHLQFDGSARQLLINNNSTGSVKIGALASTPGYGCIHFGESSPDTTNYAFLGTTGQTLFNVKSTGTMEFRYDNSKVAVMTDYRWGIGYNSSVITDTSLAVYPGNSSYKGIVIKGVASQSGDLMQLQNSSGTVLGEITAGASLGLGVTSPSAKAHFLATTEQLRLGYDASNYLAFVIDSANGATRYLGYKFSAFPPSTTQFPNAGDFGWHYDTDAATLYWAFNKSGSVKKVALT